MSEKMAAICSNCKQATSGKIYDPYWCAECKINELEEALEFYKEECKSSEIDRNKWLKKYNEESSLKVKYKNAFELLYEKIGEK